MSTAAALIPAASGRAYDRCVACLRRGVDRSVLHVAGDRRLEGRAQRKLEIQEARADR
jgi:hypothetical protein